MNGSIPVRPLICLHSAQGKLYLLLPLICVSVPTSAAVDYDVCECVLLLATNVLT
jgi:hypothetical protein